MRQWLIAGGVLAVSGLVVSVYRLTPDATLEALVDAGFEGSCVVRSMSCPARVEPSCLDEYIDAGIATEKYATFRFPVGWCPDAGMLLTPNDVFFDGVMAPGQCVRVLQQTGMCRLETCDDYPSTCLKWPQSRPLELLTHACRTSPVDGGCLLTDGDGWWVAILPEEVFDATLTSGECLPTPCVTLAGDSR